MTGKEDQNKSGDNILNSWKLPEELWRPCIFSTKQLKP